MIDDSLAEVTNEGEEDTIRRLQLWTQQMNDEIRSLRNQLNTAQSNLQSYEQYRTSASTIPSLENRIHELESSILTKEREVSDWRTRFESMKSELSTKEAALMSSSLSDKEAVKKLQLQLTTTQSEAQEKFRKLGEQYNLLVEKTKQLQSDLKGTQTARDALQLEKEQLSVALSQTNKLLSETQTELQGASEDVARLQQEQLGRVQAEQHVADLQEEVSRCHQQLSLADQNAKERQQQLEEAIQERDAAKSQASDAMVKLQLSSQRVLQDQETLQTRLEEQMAQYRMAQQDLEATQQQLREAQAEVTKQRTLAMRLQDLVEEKTKEGDVLQQLQGEVAAREADVANLQRQVQQLQSAVAAKDVQSQQLQEDIARSQKNQEAANDEVKVVRDKLHLLRNAIVDCCRDANLSASSLDRSVSLYSRFVERKRMIDDSLAEVTNEGEEDTIRRLQLWTQQMNDEIRSLRNQLNTAQSNLQSYEQYRTSASTIPSLENRIHELESSILTKEREVSDWRTRFESMKSELSTKEAALEQAAQQAQSLSDSLRVQKAQLDAVQMELQKAQEAASNSSRQALEKMMAAQGGSPGAPDLQTLLRNTQRQLEKMKAELSEKEQKMVLLEAEKATSGRRLKEALATIQQLRAATSREPSFASDPQLTKDLEATRGALRAAEQARDQYVNLYSECVKQLETKVAELEQARQQVALKEQECGRLSSLLQSGQTTGLSQLTETIQSKDRQLAQLQSEVQRLTFSASQTKRDAELAKTQLQQQVADLRVQLASRQNDSVRVAELQGKLDSKTQEASQLQQQLLTEIGLVESLKSNYMDLDRLLGERLPQGSSSSAAMLQAKEDHNQYLQKMVTSLETQNQDLRAQLLALQSQLPQSSQSSRELLLNSILQRIVASLGEVFPQAVLTTEVAGEYVAQLVQSLKDERALYGSMKQQLSEAQRVRSDLEQKVLVLQNYASGHAHIDEKADAFVQSVVQQRNDFEQKYNNVKMDLEKKNTEMQQLTRALKQEKNTVLKLLNSDEKKKSSSLPPEFSSLIEECMRVCLLAKLDKGHKMESLSDILQTMRLVRQSIAATLNLLKRENERLDCENKRIREASEKEKENNDRVTMKVKEIIRIVQSQGKALKEFVVAFQAMQRKSVQ